MGWWIPRSRKEKLYTRKIYKYFKDHHRSLGITGKINLKKGCKMYNPSAPKCKIIILTATLSRKIAKKAFGVNGYKKSRHGETVSNFHKYVGNKKMLTLPTEYYTSSLKKHFGTTSLKKRKTYWMYSLNKNKYLDDLVEHLNNI